MTTSQRSRTTSAWDGFQGGLWRDAIDVRDFIQRNYTPYEGDAAFLVGPTERTAAVWRRITDLFPKERARGVYDIAYDIPSGITAHAPGYIDRERELIVGLQTDAPLRRAIMPNGGWRMVAGALRTYGYPVDPELEKVFTRYRKTHRGEPLPGHTAVDPAANVEGVAAFAASLGNVTRVDVLPFHKLGAPKWLALGLDFPLADTPVPTPEQTAEARSVFAAHGLYAV
ncbi:pyruvate formate lyase family protein [Kitasatospora sp. NPDC101235]|uniref:pyruvate formate lyase family protein n=1 Tax=Kitasatospora sp. NPDC101235 TaxID=3364101 RepID=UPI0037F379FE